ncbi:MAG: tetratricopeptide repeat protein [Gammaproteobacteria bacterium]|nr:tetratricopeptide repeat protein [Gammaproteobacteria bacterium]
MNHKLLTAITLTLLLTACDRQAARMTEAAEKCVEAMRIGADEIAEELCTMALGDNDGADLKPEIRSQRLYRLGHIKRTLAKYPEAQGLIAQSLEIEETLSDSENLARGHSLLEMSLIMAALGQWEQGATFLERALPFAGQFSEEEQASMANILRHYAGQLEKLQQTELASRFRAAHDGLTEGKQSTPAPFEAY